MFRRKRIWDVSEASGHFTMIEYVVNALRTEKVSEREIEYYLENVKAMISTGNALLYSAQVVEELNEHRENTTVPLPYC